MSMGGTDRIEWTADAGAAAALAAASAYALAHPFGAAVAAAGAAFAFVAAYHGLRSVRPLEPGFALAEFALAPVEAQSLDELALTDADRWIGELVLTEADRLPVEDELVLDDALPQPAADSRVVRLFDPSTMPGAGDGHATVRPGGSAPPDASQALHQALADLRRALR